MDTLAMAPSSFWQILFHVWDASNVVSPVLLTVAGLRWVNRYRSIRALVGCLGTLLVISGVLFLRLKGGAIAVVSSPYPQPGVSTSWHEFFLAFYATGFGYLLTGVGWVWHFSRKT